MEIRYDEVVDAVMPKLNKIIIQEKRDNESFADVITRLSSKRGKLKDCFGAWDMDDDEEKEMFANLRRFWKQNELRGVKL